MFAKRRKDFWTVNSYAYPNPFSGSAKALDAWKTLLSFFEFEEYTKLKEYWDSSSSARRISPHALESWKATFEEFGLLYVVSRSNRITITSGGRQLFEAAKKEDKFAFGWIGLNLLMRYPLHGPRAGRRGAHRLSDIFLYRLFHALLLELDNELWWSELERIACRIFHDTEIAPALEDLKQLRASPSRIGEIDRAREQRRGGFYNSLNQVANHAGMNDLIVSSTRENSPYKKHESDCMNRVLRINKEWFPYVTKALRADGDLNICAQLKAYTEALPVYKPFDSEEEYFDFVGAEVEDYKTAGSDTLKNVSVNGVNAVILEDSKHYKSIAANRIVGPQSSLCQLILGQVLIITGDRYWTYRILKKELIAPDSVCISLRRSRPISNFSAIEALLKEE